MDEKYYSFSAREGSSRITSGGRDAFTAECGGGEVAASFYYSANDKPLTLRAKAEPGEEITLAAGPCRLALYCGGQLADEEWCFGEPLFGSLTDADGDIKISEKYDFPARGGSKARSFVGAENIRLPGVNIGDCMPYSEGEDSEVYHLFYLYDRHHHRSKWGFGAHQWAHVSTRDFVRWDEHPMAIPISEPWEGSICTGSVIKAGGKYYAWYAARMSDRSPARLTCSVSEDLEHFEKTGKFFTLPAAYDGTSARDPKVLEYGGKYHMFVTTTRLSDGRGCLAHLESGSMDDMDGWSDRGAVMVGENDEQPECSDWFRLGGRYYLVCSLGGRARYMYSDEPFAGWKAPEDNIIPCGSVPKAAFVGGKLIFSGFIGEGGYAGHLTVSEARAEPDGRLKFVDVESFR